jgi:hypothetical protein
MQGQGCEDPTRQDTSVFDKRGRVMEELRHSWVQALQRRKHY